MSQTLAEKLLASHALDEGRPISPEKQRGVHAGDLIEVAVDVVLANDITAPLAIREFEKLGVDSVFDPDAVVLVADHFTPNKDIASAEQSAVMRRFAAKLGLTHYYDVGRAGIEHVLLPEQGLVGPGDVVVGADSHTCTYGALGAFSTGMGSTDIAAAMATGATWMRVPETIRVEYTGNLAPWVGAKDLILYTIGQLGVDGARYRAIEFAGPVIDMLPMSGRFTMANMAIETGGKVGLFRVDETTRAYVADHPRSGPRISVERATDRAASADVGANYERILNVDSSGLGPQVAFPFLPENVRPVGEVGRILIDQVVIGSCTNGRLDDLRVAAEILRGHSVNPGVRCIVLPGSQQIVLQAMSEGLLEIFIEAGAAVSTPTCGPCLGGHMGVLASGERAVSTTNRNFRGRMGHPESEVYLAGPAVAAASAITGWIASPEEVLR
ncbi:MAG: 3-isopropylmalate dehydratase large subunit [Candidatus Bipolaricaulota bacterium]